jgi:hypothetical protein
MVAFPSVRQKGCDNLCGYIIDVSCSQLGFQSRSVTVTPVPLRPGQLKLLNRTDEGFVGFSKELKPLALVRETESHSPILQILL